jgi:putative nucleotidyltransferase with HDIG domain
MKILALTDGSPQASAALQALDGLVHVDTHVFPAPLPLSLRPPRAKLPNIVVVAVQDLPGKGIDVLTGWLTRYGLMARPRIICLPMAMLSTHASAVRSFSEHIIGLPAQPIAILDRLQAIDIRFQGRRGLVARPSAASSQELARLFGGAFGDGGGDAAEVVGSVTEAAQHVCDALDAEGLGEWLGCVSNYHSYTARHCMTVAGFAAQWARLLKVSDEDYERFTRAALLHDIGKMKVPLSILDKSGPLSDDERIIVNRHPTESKRILDGIENTDPVVIELAYAHHELLDGSGYPRGLKGDEISDLVRCMTIVDIYSALTDARAYKESMPPDEAYDNLRSMKGQLDMAFVDAFRPVVDAHRQQLGEAA